MRAALDLGEQWNDQLVCPLFWVPSGQPCVVFRAPGSSNYLVLPAIFRMHPISNSFDLNIRPLVLPVPAFGTVLPMNLMEAPVPGPGFSVDRDIALSLAAVPAF